MDRPSVRDYFQRLVDSFGAGWNRFWYTPGDPLPLCVIRILTGLVALYVHATYTPDIVAFFQDGGLLPVSLTSQLAEDSLVRPGALSYLSYLHTPTELYVAHAFGGVVLVLFTIGWYSRVTSVLALVVTLSYVHRAPVVTSEIEPILTMLQFYLCLGPCGAYLSVDSWLRGRRGAGATVPRGTLPVAAPVQTPSTSATIAIRLIQVHTCVVYLMMGLAKLAGPSAMENIEFWRNPWGAGDAVWLLVARPISPMVDLTWLHSHPTIVQAWTHAVPIFELMFGLLICNRMARPLLLGVAVPMWALLALISGAAPLSLLMLTANLAYFSPDYLRSWLGGRTTGIPRSVAQQEAAVVR